jgi:hypothetical protein
MLTGYHGEVSVLAWGQLGDRPVLVSSSIGDGRIWLWDVEVERFEDRLLSYRTDDPTDPDWLGRDAEAAALAEMITAQSARPPLAIGLFGDWGKARPRLLDGLRGAGAQEQAAALADRAAARVPLDHPYAVAGLLDGLREAGAEQQAAALLRRDPAAAVSLDDPGGVARLLDSLRGVTGGAVSGRPGPGNHSRVEQEDWDELDNHRDGPAQALPPSRSWPVMRPSSGVGGMPPTPGTGRCSRRRSTGRSGSGRLRDARESPPASIVKLPGLSSPPQNRDRATAPSGV